MNFKRDVILYAIEDVLTSATLYSYYHFTTKMLTFIFQRIRVKRWNKQPTTDLCDRMVILSTIFDHNNDLFQNIELKKIFTKVLKN